MDSILVKTEETILIPRNLFELQNILSAGKWIGDIEQTKELIQEILVLFVNIDTRGHYGTEFNKMKETIEILLTPLTSSGFLNIASSDDIRPFILISPQKGQVEEIQKMVCDRNLNINEVIDISQIYYQLHLDTVDGHLEQDFNLTRLDPNILKGLGANDMKGSLATMIVLLYLFAQLNLRNFVIGISSKEEYHLTEDKKFFDRMNLKNLAIDLEPTSRASGVAVNEIMRSQSVEFSFYASEQKFKQHKDILYNRIYELVEHYNVLTPEEGHIHITRTQFGIIVSFSFQDEGFTLDHQTDFKKEISNLIETLFNDKPSTIEKLSFPGFKSKLSARNKSILNASLCDEYLQIHPLHQSHLTEFSFSEGNIGKLMHNFGSTLTILKRNHPDTILSSVSEFTPRHHKDESVSLTELIQMLERLTAIAQADSLNPIES